MFSRTSYDSARRHAAWIRRVDRGVVRVSGPDAVAWLQGLVTNDIAALAAVEPARGPGEMRYTAYLTPQGRMITDARVIRLAEALLLDVPAPIAAPLAARLDGLIFAEDVQVQDASGELDVWEVHGPSAPDAAAALAGAAGVIAVVVDDRFGVPGRMAVADAASRAEVEARLASAGAVALEPDTLEVLRVEAGEPAFLVDMDTDTIPLEAGLADRAISFTKGCYVGQEVIVRVTQRGGGRVARKLVGLDLGPAAAVPPPGAAIHAGDREIGRITSAVRSPSLGRAIGLGYVHRDFIAPGSAVTIAGADGETPAVVAETPFVA